MPNTIPEWHEIDFWSSYPINWPALWTLAALVVGIIGLSLWGGNYSGAAGLAGIGIGGGCFAWSRVLKEWHAEREERWRRAGFVLCGIVLIYQIFLLTQL